MECYHCGSAIKGGYYSHYFKSCGSVKPICHNCFEEIYWSEVFEDPNTVIIDGVAYCSTPKASQGGYGGREFTIQMNDGTIKRVGLWLNGKIPESYLKSNTAKFIS